METLVAAAVGALAVACGAVLEARDRPARAWRLLWRLSPLGERVRPWLAALAGYVLGGIGVALYFRTLPDLLAGLVFLLPLGAASAGGQEESGLAWWYWIFAALAAFYSLLRAGSANRRLDAETASVPGD